MRLHFPNKEHDDMLVAQGDTSIGAASDNSLVLDRPGISPHHASINVGDLLFEDLKFRSAADQPHRRRQRAGADGAVGLDDFAVVGDVAPAAGRCAAKAVGVRKAIDGDRAVKQVIGEVRQAFGDYRAALQQLDSTHTGLIAAQKAYEVMQGRYEVGSASFVDLITAQATLVQSEAARAQAMIGFALQTRAMENALGSSGLN
jgi:hypothetical protein